MKRFEQEDPHSDLEIFIGLAIQTPIRKWKATKNWMFHAIPHTVYMYLAEYPHTQLGLVDLPKDTYKSTGPVLLVNAYDRQRMIQGENISELYSDLISQDQELQRIKRKLLIQNK